MIAGPFARGLVVLLILASCSTTALAQEEEQPRPGPFRRLFTTLGRDLKQLPSEDSLRILVNGAIVAAAAYPFDNIATLGASSSPVLKRTFGNVGKGLGREYLQGGGALATYLAGHLFDRPRMAQVGGDLIEAQLMTATVTQALK